MVNPFVSIIVPTKNSEKYLVDCLKSIKNQTYKNFEIIIVDNFSTDKTIEIAKKFTNNIFQKGNERSEQINYGVEQAKGEYVLRIDSDFYVDKEVVKECVEKIQKRYEAVVVHNTPKEVSLLAKVRKFEIDMYKYEINYSSARFIKKSVFLDISGYNTEIIAGEDFDIQNRLNRAGVKTGFIDAENIHLDEPLNQDFWKILKKFFFYGKDANNYAKNNKDTFNKKAFRWVYFKNWKKFFRHPILGFLFIFYTILKYLAGGIGFLYGKVRK